MKALNVFKLNIFNILCFIYKCKQNLNPPVFRNILLTGQKPNIRAEMKILLKNLYVEQILVSIAFHFNLWDKIVISKELTFNDNDSLQVFKRELKRFLLSVELNDLEILK